MKKFSCKVTVFGGKLLTYSREDIAEMIINYSEYTQADNLPKWLYFAGAIDHIKGFPRNDVAVRTLLTRIFNAKTTYINVQSDQRELNTIQITE